MIWWGTVFTVSQRYFFNSSRRLFAIRNSDLRVKANIHITPKIGLTLDYVLGKVGAKYVMSNLGTQRVSQIKEFLLGHCGIREDLQKQSIHFSLRQPNGQDLNDRDWRQVSEFALKEFGLTDYPFVVVQHPGEHVHIVASVVGFHCQRWNDSFSRMRAIRCAQKIEGRFNLTVTPGILHFQAEDLPLTICDQRKGKNSEERAVVSAAVAHALDRCKGLNEFRTNLASKNVFMKYVRHRGRVFCVYGKSLWFPAYKLSRAFTLNNIVLHLARNRNLYETKNPSERSIRPITTVVVGSQFAHSYGKDNSSTSAASNSNKSIAIEQRSSPVKPAEKVENSQLVARHIPPHNGGAPAIPNARSGAVMQITSPNADRFKHAFKILLRDQQSAARQSGIDGSQTGEASRTFEEALELCNFILRDPDCEKWWRLEQRRIQEELERFGSEEIYRIVPLTQDIEYAR